MVTSDLLFSVCVPSPGIALYPGQAQLLSCKHYYEVIPPLRSPGQPGDVNCTTQRINYTDPFSSQTLVRRLRARRRAPSAPSALPLASCRRSAGGLCRALGVGPRLQQTRGRPRGVVAVGGLPALGEGSEAFSPRRVTLSLVRGAGCRAGQCDVEASPGSFLQTQIPRFRVEPTESSCPGPRTHIVK